MEQEAGGDLTQIVAALHGTGGFALWMAGSKSPMRTPMMAITTRSSSRVKAALASQGHIRLGIETAE